MSLKLGSPKSQLWLTRGNVDCHWNKLETTVKEHPFNHAVRKVLVVMYVQLLVRVDVMIFVARLKFSFPDWQICLLN